METIYASPREMPTIVTHHIWSRTPYIRFLLIAQCQQTVLKISSANGHYAHKSFIETEFSHGSDAKKTWLKCQGYEYEADPTGVPAATITARQLTVRRSAQITMYGKIATDFFSCEKHLAIGVTLRISFRRSQGDFTIVSEDG